MGERHYVLVCEEDWTGDKVEAEERACRHVLERGLPAAVLTDDGGKFRMLMLPRREDAEAMERPYKPVAGKVAGSPMVFDPMQWRQEYELEFGPKFTKDHILEPPEPKRDPDGD